MAPLRAAPQLLSTDAATYAYPVDWDQLRWSPAFSLNPVSTKPGQGQPTDTGGSATPPQNLLAQGSDPLQSLKEELRHLP